MKHREYQSSKRQDCSNYTSLSELDYSDFFCYKLESLTQTWECTYAINVKEKGSWVCICGQTMDVWIGVYMHVWDIWLLMCVCVPFLLHTFFVCWSSRPGASQGSEAFGDGSAVVYNLQDLSFFSDFYHHFIVLSLEFYSSYSLHYYCIASFKNAFKISTYVFSSACLLST